jgi:transposase
MPAKKQKFEKQELHELYVEQNLSMFEISQIKNCSESFIKTNLDYYNIPIKSCSDYVRLTLGKIELIQEYIKNNKSIKQISQEYNTGYTNIQTLLKKYKIQKRECHKFKRGQDNPLWKGGKIIPASLHYDYKHGAKRRNLLFDITIQDMEEQYIKQNGICAISGIKLNISASRNKTKESTASLDRIDSSKPYIKENIQWVHKTIQQMKWNINQDQFIEWCKIIAKNN